MKIEYKKYNIEQTKLFAFKKMNSIEEAFDIYLHGVPKHKDFQIIFWNFLRDNIIAYNTDEHIVLLKLTRKLYKLSRYNFYIAIGKHLNSDGIEMLEITRYPKSIDVMFTTTFSGKKEFSLEFFIYNNIIFYYYGGNIYSTIMYLSFECDDIVTYMLVKIIEPPSNLILDFDDFKKIYNIDHPPLSLVSYESGIEKMLRTLPDKHCRILDCCSRNTRYMNYHIPDECIIVQGSELQVQLFIHLPQKDVCKIIFNGYLGT